MTPVKTVRRENGLLEAVCEHGVGHPIYGSVDWIAQANNYDREDRNALGIHGCDRCCHDHEWQISTLKESVRIANAMLLDLIERSV